MKIKMGSLQSVPLNLKDPLQSERGPYILILICFKSIMQLAVYVQAILTYVVPSISFQTFLYRHLKLS